MNDINVMMQRHAIQCPLVFINNIRLKPLQYYNSGNSLKFVSKRHTLSLF